MKKKCLSHKSQKKNDIEMKIKKILQIEGSSSAPIHEENRREEEEKFEKENENRNEKKYEIAMIIIKRTTCK